MTIEVPEPADIVPVTMSDGATIILRRHGTASGPRLAFSHGNGLAIDIYAGFWTRFLKLFDVIVFDMRNHGRNPRHDPDAHTWERCTQDMSQIRGRISEVFEERPVAGIFHSLSAVSCLRAMSAGDDGWSKLVLFDPPMYPAADTGLLEVMSEHIDAMTRRAARRPESYASPGEFADVLKANRRFAGWPAGTHELFAQASLCHDPESGRYLLACKRELEARVFDTNRDDSAFRLLRERPDLPVSIIGADPEFDNDMPARVCALLAEQAPIDYVRIPQTTHLLQLEKPAECAEAVMCRLSPVADSE